MTAINREESKSGERVGRGEGLARKAVGEEPWMGIDFGFFLISLGFIGFDTVVLFDPSNLLGATHRRVFETTGRFQEENNHFGEGEELAALWIESGFAWHFHFFGEA